MSVQSSDARTPRVLCISSYFPEHGGGVERVAHDIARHFSETCLWTTTLGANLTDGTAEPAAAPYERLEVRCWNGLEAATGFPLVVPHPVDTIRLLRTIGRHDLVVVHEEIYLTSLLGIVWALATGVPLVVVKHTGIVPLKKRPILDRLLKTFTHLVGRPLLRRAKATVFVTEAKRDNYDPQCTISNAQVIANGIDTEMFALPDVADPPRAGVVFVGRFIGSKGLGVLQHVTRAMTDVSFTLVGWGPENPEEWRHDNVTVLRRPPRPQIAQVLRRSELALVPGVGEGIPLVALEALACGTRAVIGAGSSRTETETSRHLVAAPVDFDSPEQTARVWVDTIRSLLGQKDSNAAEQARHDAVESAHSVRAMCDAYADLVRGIIAADQDGSRRHRG